MKNNTETASLLPVGYAGQVRNPVDNIITTTTRNLDMKSLIMVTATPFPVGGAPQVRFYQSPTKEGIYCHLHHTLRTRKSVPYQHKYKEAANTISSSTKQYRTHENLSHPTQI